MDNFDVLRNMNKINLPPKRNKFLRLVKFWQKSYLHWVWHKQQNFNKMQEIPKPAENTQEFKYKDVLKQILKGIIGIFRWIFKIILWLIPLFISALYYNNPDLHYGFVFGAYTSWTLTTHQTNTNYKYWSELSVGEDYNAVFYKEFIKSYRPLDFILTLFLAVFVPINFLKPLEYWFLIFLIIIIDIYYRRYLTLDIKLDMLNKKIRG